MRDPPALTPHAPLLFPLPQRQAIRLFCSSPSHFHHSSPPHLLRYTFLLDLAVKQGYPAVLVGPTGTGKSVYVNRYLMNLPKESFTPVGISMSARTNANQTQEQVDGRLDKRRKGVYGPPPGRKAVIFVDDLNMPTLARSPRCHTRTPPPRSR